MGIYIKGMEMPMRCADCWLMDGEDHWCCAMRGKPLESNYYYGIKDRPDWCPLIEVPPHGRLIDADALRASLKDSIAALDGKQKQTEIKRLIREALAEKVRKENLDCS